MAHSMATSYQEMDRRVASSPAPSIEGHNGDSTRPMQRMVLCWLNGFLLTCCSQSTLYI
jgi:hypothetical protein